MPAVKAKGDNLRVHFKHCREVAAAIRGLTLVRAKAFLGNVLEHKEAVPFRRFIGGCSQHSQGKPHKAPGNSVRWPEKATRHFIDLLENAESNAEVRGCRGWAVGGWVLSWEASRPQGALTGQGPARWLQGLTRPPYVMQAGMCIAAQR